MLKEPRVLYRWAVVRPWPLWAMAVIVAVHWSLVHSICTADPSKVHKWLGLIGQLLGGGYIVYSLNKNLGVFQGLTVKGIAKR